MKPWQGRKTDGGKGDRNRSDPNKFRTGYEQVFPDKKPIYETRDLSWLKEKDG